MVNRVKKGERIIGLIKNSYSGLLGKNLARAVNQAGVDKVNQYSDASSIVPMKNGSKGTIKKKTQKALLHKGEVVLTSGQVKMLKRILK